VQEVIPVKRKNPYSLIGVNDISIEMLTRDRQGHKAAVGVDVGKNELVVCVVWPDRSFERPWRVKSPEELGVLVAKLVELNRQCSLTVAMESSGTYGDCFRQAAEDAGLVVHRVSAKAVKDDSEGFDGVPSNHDQKDAAIIGTLCMHGRSAPWRWNDVQAGGSDEDAAIRYWVRRLDTAQRIRQVWCGKLEGMLARHWPEAGKVIEQSGWTMVSALQHWGDPRVMASDPVAAQRLSRFGGPRLSEQKIMRLLESAKSTVGVRMSVWSVAEMKDIARSINRRRKTIGLCRRELKKLTKEHKAIQSQAAAVGLVTACVLWMCLGDPANYPSAGAYRKAMGLNLTERSSGMHKGKLKISKRGQRLSRKWLYFSALRYMQEPSVKRWAAAKKQRDGGSGAKAVTGIMRRLAAAAWHAGQGEVFDPRRLFPGEKRAVADC
jgi:transposase